MSDIYTPFINKNLPKELPGLGENITYNACYNLFICLTKDQNPF